jgi:cellulose synthase/poly-beta-1,6-N-acetylglucosamine synthase-like glycosyltransferase
MRQMSIRPSGRRRGTAQFPPVSALAIVFWCAVGLLAYAQLGYALLLAALAAALPGSRRRIPAPAARPDAALPSVTVIIAAYAEQEVIAARVANLLALDYPRERLELIVACDGSPDATPELARAAGADVVLELPRGGKVRAQDAAVRRAGGEILAFGDANTQWEADALRALIGAFEDPRVGYACGSVRLLDQGDSNQEGLYWRYEMALRTLESRLSSVTGGNGAIYATRPSSYLFVDPVMGHDLSFPFKMVKGGWRAVYVPEARASEKMVPSIEGEFARKRRMMSHGWPIVVRGGMLSPRGYGPLYALMIYSHRALRYLTPFLHLLALGANAALLGDGSAYAVTFALQLALLAAALTAPLLPARVLLLARYYVLTTASLAAGLWDWLRRGTAAGWEPAEGTR